MNDKNRKEIEAALDPTRGRVYDFSVKSGDTCTANDLKLLTRVAVENPYITTWSFDQATFEMQDTATLVDLMTAFANHPSLSDLSFSGCVAHENSPLYEIDIIEALKIPLKNKRIHTLQVSPLASSVEDRDRVDNLRCHLLYPAILESPYIFKTHVIFSSENKSLLECILNAPQLQSVNPTWPSDKIGDYYSAHLFELCGKNIEKASEAV